MASHEQRLRVIRELGRRTHVVGQQAKGVATSRRARSQRHRRVVGAGGTTGEGGVASTYQRGQQFFQHVGGDGVLGVADGELGVRGVGRGARGTE